MSDIKQQKPKLIEAVQAKSFLVRIIEHLRDLPQKKLLFASCFLHILFFSLLFINWHSQDPIKPLHIPQNIQARVVSAEELKPLQDKKESEKKAIQERLDREKHLAEQKRLKEKQRLLAKKKEKALAQKKAAEQKKREAEKLLQIKKKKEEQVKRDKEKLQREKEAKQKRAAEEKRLADVAEKKLAEQRAQQIKSQENKMLERLQKIEEQKAIAAEKARILALESERKRQEQQFLEYELTENERYMARIKTQIEGLWRIPPKSEGLKITLGIRLLPNGELSSVRIINTSGNDAFDRSAILAVKSVNRFLVPEDNKLFERNFRQFNMTFNPE